MVAGFLFENLNDAVQLCFKKFSLLKVFKLTSKESNANIQMIIDFENINFTMFIFVKVNFCARRFCFDTSTAYTFINIFTLTIFISMILLNVFQFAKCSKISSNFYLFSGCYCFGCDCKNCTESQFNEIMLYNELSLLFILNKIIFWYLCLIKITTQMMLLIQVKIFSL